MFFYAVPLPPPSTPYPRLLHLFFLSFSVQGCCYFCERDSRYLHVQYHPSHSEAHSKEARTRIFFFSVPYTTRPTTTMTNPPTRPSGPHVYLHIHPPSYRCPIGSCETHLFIITVFLFFCLCFRSCPVHRSDDRAKLVVELELG